MWDGQREQTVDVRVTPRGVLAPDMDFVFTAPQKEPFDDAAELSGARVWVERSGPHCRVLFQAPNQDAVVVWSAAGTAAAPALATAQGGTWVAFHHNVREDTGQADVAKWIAVRFVDDDGRVFEPSAEMTDRNRDLEGEEQSFEFPSLWVGPDGSVALFGRGSHAFYRQDINAEGFGPRTAIGDTGWGCRGRRVAVSGSDDGLLIARRVRKGILVESHALPQGGRPKLGPVSASASASDSASVSVSVSVPTWDGPHTLFGDIHQHSAHSDGIGTADEPYLRARHQYRDDFCALSDHESFLGKRIGPGEWDYLQSVADKHNQDGEFATLIAFEWTGRMHPGPGHKVVYYPELGLPIVSRDEVPDGADLVQKVTALGGIAVPHHVGWTGADEGAHTVKGQPVWEICSCHGCYESFGHVLGQRGELRDQMVDAVLARGHKFGFIASSDGHGLLYHHGVARKRDPFRTGLTAVQTEDVTRSGILQAIRNRRCYATSGAKILLDLKSRGAPMGAFVSHLGECTAKVVGTAPIRTLELVGPSGVLASESGRGDAHLEISAEVDGAFVYARATQADGEMAWSSPIFAPAAGSSPP